EVEAGMQWPDVIRAYLTRPGGMHSPWGIRQKQTGADRLTIGGAISANIHGRGLTAAPFISDLESLAASATGVTPTSSISTSKATMRRSISAWDTPCTVER